MVANSGQSTKVWELTRLARQFASVIPFTSVEFVDIPPMDNAERVL